MIRKMKLSELDQVADIWLNSNLEAHDFIDKEYWLNNLSMVKQQFRMAEIYIFEDKQIITGFIGLQDDYIAGIFVKKEYRHQAIGRQLLETVKKTHTVLTLDVYAKNQAAIKFYLDNDFEISSEDMDEINQEKEYQMIWKKAV